MESSPQRIAAFGSRLGVSLALVHALERGYKLAPNNLLINADLVAFARPRMPETFNTLRLAVELQKHIAIIDPPADILRRLEINPDAAMEIEICETFLDFEAFLLREECLRAECDASKAVLK